MSNFNMSDEDKEKLKKMNLFGGYQCERDPALYHFIKGECFSNLGINIENCLVCPNWKNNPDEINEDDEE